MRGVSKSFIDSSTKSWSNSGDISLPWNCASNIKSHSHHPEWHQPPIEEKLPSHRLASAYRAKTSHLGLIIYTHSTCTNLRYFAHDKIEGKLPNHCGNTKKSCTYLSPWFHWLTPETERWNLRWSPSVLITFSYTRKKKKNPSPT